MRSRRITQLNLKTADGIRAAKKLVKTADAVVEGFRPGVMEGLGLGPNELLAVNPRLVYGRMTGWGQSGPYARTAGHDLNYISLTGALNAIGPADGPVPPLALIGDMGGGGMFLAYSVAAALLYAHTTGRGQVIDCAMVDGANLLATAFHEWHHRRFFSKERQSNILDGGAHYYNVYRTADELFISVAAIEPQFYDVLLDKLNLKNDPEFRQQNNKSLWPKLRSRLAAIFAGRTRSQWCDLFKGSDACITPVLDWDEAPEHPQMKERRAFIEIDGVVQPRPAPFFSESELSASFAPRQIDIEELI